MSNFELDPREAERYVRGLPERQELIYRLAIRGLCVRCRGDRQFRQRTDELLARRKDLGDLATVLKEAGKLADELVAAVESR